MGGDQQVVRSDGSALRLQVGANLRVARRRLLRPVEHQAEGEEVLKRRGILLLSPALADLEPELGQNDGRDADREVVGPHSGPYGSRPYRRVRCADRAPLAEVMINAVQAFPITPAAS